MLFENGILKTKMKLKTDNLCCPKIGPGYIQDGDKHQNLPEIREN